MYQERNTFNKVYVGSGTYGTVYKDIMHSTSGESLAVKTRYTVITVMVLTCSISDSIILIVYCTPVLFCKANVCSMLPVYILAYNHRVGRL